MRVVGVMVLCVIGGCADPVDPPWQLDHDRIVAVRATPPRVLAGEGAVIDVLVAHRGSGTTTQKADALRVLSPLDGVTVADDRVVAPPAERITTIRGSLGLATDAPVPVVVQAEVDGLVATKTVWIGGAGGNPGLDGVRIGGTAPMGPIVVSPAMDVSLEAGAAASAQVTWLSSCGTLHDFDLDQGRLRVEPADPQAGELAVVIRAVDGGTSWSVWPIRAE